MRPPGDLALSKKPGPSGLADRNSASLRHVYGVVRMSRGMEQKMYGWSVNLTWKAYV